RTLTPPPSPAAATADANSESGVGSAPSRRARDGDRPVFRPFFVPPSHQPLDIPGLFLAFRAGVSNTCRRCRVYRTGGCSLDGGAGRPDLTCHASAPELPRPLPAAARLAAAPRPAVAALLARGAAGVGRHARRLLRRRPAAV